jgi:hypothetical protein
MLGLIIIFVLLGLAFLVGGVGAIIDGWPYLVLERGFTEVIIGTVAATAGVILLALAWVLTELRRVRVTLRAMTLLSAVGLPGETVARTVGEERAPPGPVAPEPESRLPGLGPVAAGAGLAAAGGALATVFADRGIGQHQELAEEPTPVAQDEAARDRSEPAQPEAPANDLFDEALIDAAATGKSENEALPASAHELAGPEISPNEAAEESKDDEAQPVAAASDDVASDDALAAVPTGYEPVAGRDAEVRAAPEPEPGPVDEPAPEPEAVAEQEPSEEPKRSTWWPRFGSRASESAVGPRIVEADDLTALRHRLTLGPQPPANPAEPEEAAAGERRDEPDLGAAEAWMGPAFGRREPSFDQPVPAEPAAPEPEPEQQAEPVEELPVEAVAEPPAIEEAEAATEEPPAEPPGPAASEEGIVGAYQVGDTHFTMYADGSIKARTPEGEYSFASMDELKTYLASEKSRLGG